MATSYQKRNLKLARVIHAFHPSTQEAETELEASLVYIESSMTPSTTQSDSVPVATLQRESPEILNMAE